jgi:hypothetical protein
MGLEKPDGIISAQKPENLEEMTISEHTRHALTHLKYIAFKGKSRERKEVYNAIKSLNWFRNYSEDISLEMDAMLKALEEGDF